MELNENHLKVLEFLVDNKETKTEDIIENTNIKIKLVKKTITFLQVFVQSYDSELVIKKGDGIHFVTSKSDYFWRQFIGDLKRIKIEDLILIDLIATNDMITMTGLADKYFVSTTTINKIITGYDYKIIKKKNIGIKLDETDFMKKEIVIKIIIEHLDVLNLEASLKKIVKAIFSYDLIEDDIFEVKHILEKLNIPKRDEFYIEEFVRLVVMKILGFSKVEKNDVIFLMFNFNLDAESNRYYLDLCDRYNRSYNNKRELYNLLLYIENKYGISFDFDIDLFIKFSNHIDLITKKNYNNRIASNKIVNNIEEFRRKYPFAYEIGEDARDYLSNKLNCPIPPEEAFYMAIYFQIYFEHRNDAKNINCIIICDYSVAMSEYISSSIKRDINNINVVGVYSIREFAQKYEGLKTGIDIVITTVNLIYEFNDTKVIYLDNLDINGKINEVKDVVDKMIFKKTVLNLFDDNYIYFLNNVKAKELMLKDVNDDLVGNNIVNEDYIETVLKREIDASTVIDSVALPHGNHKCVFINKVVIIILDEPIMWVDDEVRVIVWTVLTSDFIEKNSKHVSRLYRRFTNDRVVTMLQEATDVEAVKQVFTKYVLE